MFLNSLPPPPKKYSVNVLFVLLALLFPAAAEAQTTVWSATLTVDQGPTDELDQTPYGCRNTADLDDCSAALSSDDSFVYDSVTYSVRGVWLEVSVFGNDLYVLLDKAFPAALRTAATLTAGADTASLSSATFTDSNTKAYWPSSDLGAWTDGQQVSLSLTLPPPAGVTIEPTGLTVAEGSTASYTVQVTRRPQGIVVITVGRSAGSDTDLSVKTPSNPNLTFNASNWNDPQTVTLQAAVDTDDVNGMATFTHTVGSTGGDYTGVTAASVTATEVDQGALRLPPPANLQAEPGDGAVTLRWNPVPRARGYRFRVLEGRRVVRDWDWVGGGTSAVVTGLTNGTSYQFRVRTMSRGPATDYIQWVGGEPSDPVSAAPEGPPAVPGNDPAPPDNNTPSGGGTGGGATGGSGSGGTGGGGGTSGGTNPGPVQSSDVALSGLEILGMSIDFDPGKETYTAYAPRGTGRVMVTPTARDGEAVITVNGERTQSGASVSVDLEEEETGIEITVTAEDGTVRTYTVTVMAKSCPEERNVLLNFYETTGGEDWHDNENWNSSKPVGQWYGVRTDDEGRVISLRLAGNGLSGELPGRELLCLSQLRELSLWENDGLRGEVPQELALAVERAVLRDVAQALSLNAEWFDNYEEPYEFGDWYGGVTTDNDGRVTGLDFTGEGIRGEIPGSVFELRELEEISLGCEVSIDPEAEAPERVTIEADIVCEEEMEEETADSGGGGCALGSGDSSASGLFLLALFAFAALWRKRTRG